jgi:hypothetical protein
MKCTEVPMFSALSSLMNWARSQVNRSSSSPIA